VARRARDRALAASAGPGRAATLRAWATGPAGRRGVLVALGAATAGMFVTWVRSPGDFAGYLEVGRLVLEGRHIYADATPGVNTWPPAFALFAVPLAWLAGIDPVVPRALWLLLNLALLGFALDRIARLVWGRRLAWRPGPDALSLADPPVLVPLLLSARYVLSNFNHVQVNLFIFACALHGLALQARGRPRAGGAWLGLAASLKVMPIAFLPYLVYRRRWRVAAWMAGTVLAVSAVAPAAVFGPARAWEYAQAWRAAVAEGWGVGKMNQSVYAMLDRFLGHGMVPFAVRGANDVPASGAPEVALAVAVALAAVLVAAGWAFRGRPNPDHPAALAEWSAVFLVAALFGPVTWKAYLVVTLLPHALLYAAARDPARDAATRRIAAATLLAAFALGNLTTRLFWGGRLAGMWEMASAVTIAQLLLLAGCLAVRARWPLPER
jgi:alpha-1,2-mannosyltransferase